MRRFIAALAAPLFVLAAAPAAAQERHLGETFLTAASFCPRGSLPADGRSLEINTHSALFSLLGATYGGDGRTTFALPDLSGRAPVHAGQTVRGADIALGQSITGTPGQGDPRVDERDLPLASQIAPSRTLAPEESVEELGPDPALATPLHVAPDSGAGLAMTWCVAVSGVYPARN